MVLDWLGGKGGKQDSLSELIARKNYAKAVELLQANLNQRPKDGRLRLQLADTLILAGRGREAVGILRGLADELASEGFAAKSIAILKRIQKIEPASGVEDRLASMIEQKNRLSDTALLRMRVSAPLPEFGMEEIGIESPASARVTSAPEPAATPAAVADVDYDYAASSEESVAAEPPVISTPLFPDFTKEELVALMQGLKLIAFEPGDIVVAEGAPGDSLFLLTTGEVKAWIKTPDGHYRFVRTLGEGDFFGEISVLTGKPRTATVTTAGPCELLELDRRTLDLITTYHPRVRQVLQQFYDQRNNSDDEARIRSGLDEP